MSKSDTEESAVMDKRNIPEQIKDIPIPEVWQTLDREPDFLKKLTTGEIEKFRATDFCNSFNSQENSPFVFSGLYKLKLQNPADLRQQAWSVTAQELLTMFNAGGNWRKYACASVFPNDFFKTKCSTLDEIVSGLVEQPADKVPAQEKIATESFPELEIVPAAGLRQLNPAPAMCNGWFSRKTVKIICLIGVIIFLVLFAILLFI